MNLVGRISISGKGSGGGASDWNHLKGKPFETLGDDFTVDNGELQLAGVPVAEVDWDDIENKPDFAEVATTGDYEDLTNKPTIPENVSDLNNDAGYVSSSEIGDYTYPDAGGSVCLSNASTYNMGRGWGDSYWFDANAAEQALANGNFLHIKYTAAGSTNDQYPYEMWGTFTFDPSNPYSFEVKGWESILDGVDYDATQPNEKKWRFIFKSNVSFVLNVEVKDISVDKQNINAYFLPVDDSTIKVNSDGEIYAVSGGGGGSVDIDNKSIVKNANNELETAVPLYTEEITEVVKAFTLTPINYPSGMDADFFFETNGQPISLVTNTEYPPYIAQLFMKDGTVYEGEWVASADPGHTYGGWTWTVGGNSYELYFQYDEVSGYTIHIYMNGTIIQGSGSDGNIRCLKIIPSSNEDADTNLNDKVEAINPAYIVTERITRTVVHQLPNEYFDIKDKVIGVDTNYNESSLYTSNGKISSRGMYSEDGSIEIGVNHWNVYIDGENTRNVENYNLKALPSSFSGGMLPRSSEVGETYWNSLNTPEFTIHNNKFYCTNFIYDTNNNSWWIKISYLDNSAQLYYYKAYGRLIETYNEGDLHPTLTAEGLDGYLDSITYSSDMYGDQSNVEGYIFELKNGYVFSDLPQITSNFHPDSADSKQDINAYFLPLDNNTLKVNSEGKVVTAIPPVPTNVDDTYTLHASVVNGEVSYYWVGTPQ